MSASNTAEILMIRPAKTTMTPVGTTAAQLTVTVILRSLGKALR